MRAKVNGVILGVLISIPIIIAKVKSGNKPDCYVPEKEVSVVDIELMQTETHKAEAPTEIPTTEVPTTEAPTEPPIPIYDIALSEELQIHNYEMSAKYEICAELVLGLMMQESSCSPDVIGDNGKAFGLGQIRVDVWENTAIQLGLGDYKTNPKSNIEMIYHILTENLNRYNGDLRMALNGYRHGQPTDCIEPNGKSYPQIIFENMEKLEDLQIG